MKISLPSLRVLSITLLVLAGQLAAPAYAERQRDGGDGRGGYQSESAQRGAYPQYPQYRQERMAPQYAQAYPQQYPPQYQQYPQPRNPQGAQPRDRRYELDPRPQDNGRGGDYQGRNPQYSQEDADRSARERQTERRALLRRQINEARDLYAPVRKP